MYDLVVILTVRIAYFVLASSPGSLPVRGRKGEPGTHKKSPEFGRFVISPHSIRYE